jgi:hypothetical protein
MEAFSTWFKNSDYVKNNIGMQTRDSILNLVNHQQLDALITEYNLNESTIVKNWRSKSMKAGEASLVLLALRKLDINAKRQKEKEMYNQYKKELNEEKEHIEHLNEHIQHLNDKNKDILETANNRRTFIDFIANEIGVEKMNSIDNKFMGKGEQNNQVTDDENKQNDQDDLMKSSESEPIIVIAHSYIIKNKNKVRRATFNPKTDYAFNTQNGFYISGEKQELVSKFSIDISAKCIGYIVLKDGTKLTTLTRKTVLENSNNIKMIILVRKSKNDKENEAVLNELYNAEKELLQFKSRATNNEDTTGIEQDLLNMTMQHSLLEKDDYEKRLKMAIKNSLTPPSSPNRNILAQAAENRNTLVPERRKFSKRVKLFVDKVLKSMEGLKNPGDGLANQLFFIAELGNVEKEIQWSGKTFQIKDIADDLIWNVLFNYIKKYGETFIPESIWGNIKSIWSQNTQY